MARGKKKTEAPAVEAAAVEVAVEMAEAEAAETKAEEIKAEEAAEPKSEEPEAPRKKRAYTRRKTKAAEAAEAPKEPETSGKKAPGKRGGRRAVIEKFEVSIQYGGRNLSQEDLLKIAKDVWKYDLKQKASALSSVELYVKPEENKVYYVMNGDMSGNFDI